MTIYAQALADNRNYKNARIDGKLVGIPEARAWQNAVKAIRIPAYAIRQYRHANLGNAEVAAPCDMSAFFAALNKVLDMVGEVNGAKLHAENIADEVLAHASRVRAIDVTNEMAEARYNKRKTAQELDEFDQEAVNEFVLTMSIAKAALVKEGKMTTEEFHQWEHSWTYEGFVERAEAAKTEVERLESEPGNCKKLFEINNESAFVKAVEILLGDAINKQAMKTAEQVAAEEEARRQARRAQSAAKRAAKRKSAQAQA